MILLEILKVFILSALIYLIIRELDRLGERDEMLDEKLSGIADALSAGFDGLGVVVNEIQLDIIELKDALAAEPSVSAATIAKFEALKTKFDAHREALASIAAIVPEPVVEPDPVVTEPVIGSFTSGGETFVVTEPTWSPSDPVGEPPAEG